MRKADILRLPSMPAAGPSYPAGPYRFINREFMVITYETDAEVIAEQLPEPLEPLDTAPRPLSKLAVVEDHAPIAKTALK